MKKKLAQIEKKRKKRTNIQKNGKKASRNKTSIIVMNIKNMHIYIYYIEEIIFVHSFVEDFIHVCHLYVWVVLYIYCGKQRWESRKKQMKFSLLLNSFHTNISAIINFTKSTIITSSLENTMKFYS